MKNYKYLTFDCYGTLIKYELSSYTKEVLGDRIEQLKDVEQFLEDFHYMRFVEVFGEYKSYRNVLADSLQRAMNKHGLEYRHADGARLAEVVPTFGPFPDVPAVLQRLSEHYKLVILSNTDDDIIAGNVKKLGAPFYRVITAETARAYKPSLKAFRCMLNELNAQPGDVLHIAQDFYYDMVPGQKLGLDRLWINRYNEKGEPGYEGYREYKDLIPVPDFVGI